MGRPVKVESWCRICGEFLPFEDRYLKYHKDRPECIAEKRKRLYKKKAVKNKYYLIDTYVERKWTSGCIDNIFCHLELREKEEEEKPFEIFVKDIAVETKRPVKSIESILGFCMVFGKKSALDLFNYHRNSYTTEELENAAITL